MSESLSYEGWAIVEVFGHRRLAGLVRQVNQFGTVMMRIDIPKDKDTFEAAQFYGGAALFSVTPCTKEAAREENTPRPIARYALPNREERPINLDHWNDDQREFMDDDELEPAPKKCHSPGCVQTATHGLGGLPTHCWSHAGDYPECTPVDPLCQSAGCNELSTHGTHRPIFCKEHAGDLPLYMEAPTPGLEPTHPRVNNGLQRVDDEDGTPSSATGNSERQNTDLDGETL